MNLPDPTVKDHKEEKLSLSVGAKYMVRLGVVNGAGLMATFETNGVIIDNTPPNVSKLVTICLCLMSLILLSFFAV